MAKHFCACIFNIDHLSYLLGDFLPGQRVGLVNSITKRACLI